MGFPSVLERIAKTLGLYPKNDPNNRNIPQGIGLQQPGRNEETPIQDRNTFQQGFGRNTNPTVNAGSAQDPWRQPDGSVQQPGFATGGSGGQPLTQQTPYRPDNIVRMPDRDARDYYPREPYSEGPYQREAYNRDMGGAGRDMGGRDAEHDMAAGRNMVRDAVGREPSGRGAYGYDMGGRDPYGRDMYGRDPYGGDPYGRDPYAQSQQQMMYAPSTIIFCVRRKEDSSEIINYLLAGLNVILTFEDVDDVQCQRVLDFVGGAAFALEGSVEKISYRNYFVAPRGAAVVRSESQVRNHLRDASSGYYSSRY